MPLTKAQLLTAPGGPGVTGAVSAGQNIIITADGTISANAGGQPIGTVTSIGVSGASTGMTFANSPITGASAVTFGGVLLPANGGTGATTQAAAATALLPSQSGQNGNYLTTNGTIASWAPAPAAEFFPPGTKLVFTMNTAPTGWVLDTSNDNKMLRVSTGTGGGGGGSASFTDVFTNRIIPLVDHGHAVNQGGGHVHSYTVSNSQNRQHGQGQGKTSSNSGQTASNTGGAVVSFEVFSASQSGQATGNQVDFSIKYVDVIVCQKS